MPGRMITNIKQIDDYQRKKAGNALLAVAKAFCYVGEQCVSIARNLPSPPKDMAGKPHQPNYIDWTENLRNSIGYAVVYNGKVIQRAMVNRTTGGSEGTAEGEQFLSERIGKASSRGVILIVTAGMNYAEYVEAKGYDVLTSSERKGKEIARSMLKQLGFDIK